jgi:hypothetical protein
VQREIDALAGQRFGFVVENSFIRKGRPIP